MKKEKKQIQTKKFYSILEVAEIIGVHPDTIRHAIHTRELAYIKVGKGGGKIIIAATDLDAYITKRRIPSVPDGQD